MGWFLTALFITAIHNVGQHSTPFLCDSWRYASASPGSRGQGVLQGSCLQAASCSLLSTRPGEQQEPQKLLPQWLILLSMQSVWFWGLSWGAPTYKVSALPSYIQCPGHTPARVYQARNATFIKTYKTHKFHSTTLTQSSSFLKHWVSGAKRGIVQRLRNWSCILWPLIESVVPCMASWAPQGAQSIGWALEHSHQE